MRNNLIGLLGVITISSILGWYFGAHQAQNASIDESEQFERASGMQLRNNKVHRSISSSSDGKHDSNFDTDQSDYFKTLMKEEVANKIYHRSKILFNDLPDGEALAIWITLGVRLDSSQDFANEFGMSLNKINQNPDQVLAKISAVYKQLGHQDVFIQSMLLNVVHQLNTSKEQKISFYSDRLEDKFELDRNGDPTPASLNITNSMAFLNQYKFDKENLKVRIESSLLEHRANKKSQSALAERFTAYFPELRSDIKNWSNQ